MKFEIGDIVELSTIKMYEGFEEFRGIIIKITKRESDYPYYSVYWLNNGQSHDGYGIEELEKVSQ